MYYFCAICMINTETLLDLSPKCRRLLEAMVSPYMEFTESLKSCRILLCQDCNQLLGTMLKFQQTVLKGVRNLVALHKRSEMIYHDLPEVINTYTDILLPVVNEEVVCTSNSFFRVPISQKNTTIKTPFPKRKLRKRSSENDKKPPRNKRQTKKAKPDRDLDSTLSCESDFSLSDNPDYVPGYERLVATSQMDHEYITTNKKDMAVLVPIKNTRDKRELTNTNKSSEVKKTKLNRQLYQAIRLALESRSISDFDIAQYEPESESDFDHECESEPESHHDLKSPHHESKSSNHDSNSSHNKSMSPHHDSADRDSNSSHHDLMSSHHKSKSPMHDSRSLPPDSESTLSCESDYEDAEHFPNVVLAKAFSGVAEGSGVSEDVQKIAHLVLNPPSEWPCTVNRCYGRTELNEEYSNGSDEISHKDTRTNVKPIARRRRKECKLCDKTFVSLYRLWEHYEREHVDTCRKECCNGTAMKNGNTRRLLKVPGPPEPQKSQFNCAECAIDCRNKTQMKLHLATLRHKLRSLWRFQCDICKRKLEDKKGIAEHIEREHLAKEANKCPICAATFHSERAMRKHAAAHILAQKHAHANNHAHAHAQAHTQAHGASKRHTHKRTDTGKTPVSRNILDRDNRPTDALSNGRVKRKRKRTRWTRRRKQLARNSDTQTNVQGTPKRTQRMQPRKQLAPNSGTHTNVQGPQERTQGTQSTLARNSDTHTSGVQKTQTRTQETRKRTQTVGELRKMHKRQKRTQVENERVVNFYLNKFTLFEAKGGIGKTLEYPPNGQGSPS